MKEIKIDNNIFNKLDLKEENMCYFIVCENTVCNETLLKKLIDKSAKELHFYGKFNQIWEMSADKICVEYEKLGIKEKNWIVLTSSEDLSSFINLLSNEEINGNRKILIYDDENLKDYVVKRTEENKRKNKKQNNRIELSCFTNASKKEGIDPISDLLIEARNLKLDGLAVTDIMSTHSFYGAQVFNNKLETQNTFKIIYGCTIDFQNEICCKVLCKNNEGKKELYRILTKFNTSDETNKTNVIKHALELDKNNLLIGMDCLRNNCVCAALKGDNKTVSQEISKYDYIEIAPTKIYKLEYDNSISEIKNAIKLIIEEAKKQKKLVVATNRVCYARSEQSLIKDMLNEQANKLNDDQSDINQNILSTERMKYEFDWLNDDELVDDIVVNNTHKIAHMCEDFEPFDNVWHSPNIPNAYDSIEKHAYAQMYSIYGRKPDSLIVDRLKKELKLMKDNNFASIYYLTSALCRLAEIDYDNYSVRGSIGNTLVGYLLGISECNPLPPHYVCPNCRKLIWNDSYKDGFDMPKRTCDCGYEMKKDGHNLHYEVFMGLNGEKIPDIDLNFSDDFVDNIPAYLKEIAPNNFIIKAGYYKTIPHSEAKRLVNNFAGEDEGLLNNSTKDDLINTIENIEIGHTASPSGYVIYPKNVEIENYTPLTISDGELCSDNAYYEFNNSIYKMDCLRHTDMTAFDTLELNVIDLKNIDIDDKEIYELINGKKSYGLLGIPEFGNNWTNDLINKVKPQCFSDLIKVSGLSHGTDVWTGNQDKLFAKGLLLGEIVANRDDILDKFLEYGVSLEDSYELMELVRKGKFSLKNLNNKQINILKDHNVPDNFMEVCSKIKYMFPKAHAIGYIINSLRLIWLKIYKPEYFYAQWIIYRARLDIVGKSEEEIQNTIDSFSDSDKQEFKEDLELIQEMKNRGIQFIKGGLSYKGEKIMFEPDPSNKERTIFLS